ncbi:MAG: LptE family protein [Verrucomicrobiota bacterium]
MRALIFFISCLAAVMLTSCASYHLGSVKGTVAGEKSVTILPFNNQTLQPRLGAALTQSLRERLQTDGTFRLATRGDGDLVLTGVIQNYQREGLGLLSTDVTTPGSYRDSVIVHVTVRDRASGKLLLEKNVKGYTLVSIGTDLASAERQIVSLLAEDLARNITTLLSEGTW